MHLNLLIFLKPSPGRCRAPTSSSILKLSHHLLDELVNELLSSSEGTETLSEGVSLDLESTKWGGEFEWPQEVVGFLEVGSAGDDLVDQVLDAGNSVLGEFSGDDAVISEGNSASVDLSVSSLVDEVLNASS